MLNGHPLYMSQSLNVLSFLTPVHMVFSVQTNITEKAQSKHVLG